MLDWIILGVFQDFYFVIQIFVMVSIISFILNHLGKGVISIVLILVMFYVVFILIPALSIAAFILYTLLMAGISTLLVDFFFISMQTQAMQPQKESERPDVTGHDVAARREQLEGARHASRQAAGMMQNMMRRGR